MAATTKKNTLEYFDNFYDPKNDKCNCPPPIIRYNKVKRIIAFGDIHGDLKLLKTLLELAKLAKFDTNNNPVWIGGDTYLVQVGDQVDRCRPPSASIVCSMDEKDDENSDVIILELFNELNRQAITQGGRVISLLGNHELMNVFGKFQYVSPKGLYNYPSYKGYNGEEARRESFKAGNAIGKLLGCTRVPLVIIGQNIFCHAGITDEFIEDIKRLFERSELFLSVENQQDHTSLLNKYANLIYRWLVGLEEREDVIKLLTESITNQNSILWTRNYGANPSADVCRKLENVFNKIENQKLATLPSYDTTSNLKIGKMIVGHTVQSSINSACSDKLFRIDYGGSIAFSRFNLHDSSYPYQFLEIIDDNIYNLFRLERTTE